MKRILSLAALVAVVLTFASCGKSELEIHQTFFYPQKPGGMIFYADQTKDTIRLCSLDSWTLSSTASWLTATPTQLTVPENHTSSQMLTLTCEVNTTGETRYGAINVQSHDAIGMGVTQYSWLKITSPAAFFSRNTAVTTTSTPIFYIDTDAAERDTSIVFTVYQNGATLSSPASWITPEETTFIAGEHTVKVHLAANTEGEKRSAALTLTSAGISTPITFTQSK